MPTAPTIAHLLDRPFAARTEEDIDTLALELFHLHCTSNPVYGRFVQALGIDRARIERAADIPHLPITLFKRHRILLEGLTADHYFTSSGTTGMETSRHHVPDLLLYERSFMTSFTARYGAPSRWRILALLPSYLERSGDGNGGSSLVYMAQRLMEASGDPLSGTYLDRLDDLSAVLRQSEAEGRPTLLLGVTFALLDLAERHPLQLRHTVVMETGGMKGRRPELVREELHRIIREAFGVDTVHSEYGMTELLSQAWSDGDGLYRCPPWMRVRLRDVNDPLSPAPTGRTGGIDVMDLANIASCPFISTQDLGRMHPDGSFEVLGRFDHSQVRGCNLLVGN
jgi:phenylacetate-coenzyme A ligase PaaK-like adenylate-forming protein